MKILIVGNIIDPPFNEGKINTTLNWAKALSQKNVDVQLLSISSNYSGHHKFFGVNFEYLKTQYPRFIAHPQLSEVCMLQKAVINRAKSFDIVHYAFNMDNNFYSLPSLSILKLKNTKIINSYHFEPFVKLKFFRNILVNAFTVPSKRMFNLIKQRIPQKVRIIPPCIDTTMFQPRNKLQAREKLGLSKDDFIIFTVGHFKRGRRFIPFVQTVEEIRKKRKNIQLLIGWSGYGDKDNIQETMTICEKKKFVKIIPPTDLINYYYNAVDVYVLTATSDYVIDMPMSTIEALSSGVPVLSFNINSVSEIIENGVNGYLIEDGNFNEMKNILDHLIENKLLLKELSKNARNTILNNFSYTKVGNQLERLYAELLEK